MDLVTVSVDAVVYYRVEDPVRAETQIEECRSAAARLRADRRHGVSVSVSVSGRPRPDTPWTTANVCRLLFFLFHNVSIA